MEASMKFSIVICQYPGEGG